MMFGERPRSSVG